MKPDNDTTRDIPQATPRKLLTDIILGSFDFGLYQNEAEIGEWLHVGHADETAGAVIAYLWGRAMKPHVIEAVQDAMDGPVLSWSTGDLKPGTAEQITIAMLAAIIGPRPTEQEATDV